MSNIVTYGISDHVKITAEHITVKELRLGNLFISGHVEDLPAEAIPAADALPGERSEACYSDLSADPFATVGVCLSVDYSAEEANYQVSRILIEVLN